MKNQWDDEAQLLLVGGGGERWVVNGHVTHRSAIDWPLGNEFPRYRLLPVSIIASHRIGGQWNADVTNAIRHRIQCQFRRLATDFIAFRFHRVAS